MRLESLEIKRKMDQDKQILLNGKIDWEPKLISAVSDLTLCYEKLSIYENCEDEFDSDYSSYQDMTVKQIFEELERLKLRISEIPDMCNQYYTSKIACLQELLIAKEKVNEVITAIANDSHNKAVESLATQLQHWEEYELTEEERKLNDKIIDNNLRLSKMVFLASLSHNEEDTKTCIENTPKSDYETPFPEQYSWKDVALSLLKYPERVVFDYDVCPKCGNPRICLYFYSPAWTWTMICGVGGNMVICPHCKIQSSFDVTIRN